jgi:hypothetical protein
VREAAPKTVWWKKKRWIASLLFVLLAAYPLSFILACWVTMRLHPVEHGWEYDLFGRAFRPVGIALIESPHAVRNIVYRMAEVGAPDGVTFERNYDNGVMWIGEDYTYTLLYYPRW